MFQSQTGARTTPKGDDHDKQYLEDCGRFARRDRLRDRLRRQQGRRNACPGAVAEAPPAPPPGPDYASFVSAPGRIDTDMAKDANRKPAEVLAFSKIMPGQTVFEMEADAGYYTELLSRAVGPSGKVIMQAPKEFEGFYKEALAARLKDNRLANVTQSWSMFDKLDAADASGRRRHLVPGPARTVLQEGLRQP